MTQTQRPHAYPFADAVSAARDTELATGVPCTLIDRKGAVLYPAKLREYPCWMCRIAARSVRGQTTISSEHAEKARQALHVGSEQIFLCRSNLMHWVAPVSSRDQLVAALVGGPVRMEEADSDFDADVLTLLRRESEVLARTQESSLRDLWRRVPIVPAARISALARQLFLTATAVSTADAGDSTNQRLQRESRISEYIQELKQYRSEAGMQAGIPTYPLATEQALLEAIRTGDTERAHTALNELLGHVFFTLGADLERIKIRAREIVVLLSRIVIARGADASRVFGYNYRALDELDGLEDLNEVAHWMARIVRGFAGSVLRVPPNAEHTTVLRKVLDYLGESYRGRVSLVTAAALAGVSPSHLSRVFSREMGETFSAYVRRLRIGHAQDLLTGTSLPVSDIAEMCGFADQSHLTLAFRNVTGTTPATFRKLK